MLGKQKRYLNLKVHPFSKYLQSSTSSYQLLTRLNNFTLILSVKMLNIKIKKDIIFYLYLTYHDHLVVNYLCNDTFKPQDGFVSLLYVRIYSNSFRLKVRV